MQDCLKLKVIAMLETVEGNLYYGVNNINNDKITECPRLNNSIRNDYSLCKTVCKQDNHAEVDAIDNCLANNDTPNDGIIFLSHNRSCGDCISYMSKHNIKEIIFNVRLNYEVNINEIIKNK